MLHDLCMDRKQFCDQRVKTLYFEETLDEQNHALDGIGKCY